MTDALRALALAAAHTPGAALVRTPARTWFALGCAPVLRVEVGECDRALARFAAVVDEVRARFDPSRDDPRRVALVGWIAYDACRAAHDPHPVIDPRPRADAAPCAWLAAPERVHVVGEPMDEVVRAVASRWEGRSVERVPLRFEGAVGEERHGAMVRDVRERIADGEVYLVNVARALHAAVDEAALGDALASRWLAADAPRGAVVNAGDVRVAAMSMELALAWDRATGVATSGPIKGTRPRSADPEEDRRAAEALAADPKERAENAMAVDVHRNDLGRVAVTGGVSVPELFRVEPHRYVHHLCSTVRAALPADLSAVELLSSMLPVGSVTGAPKIAAMNAIAEVEPERRGLYTGAYGVVFADGSLELSVAIRTLVADVAGLHYGVGGGIVWDSAPEREWDEVLWKQRAAE